MRSSVLPLPAIIVGAITGVSGFLTVIPGLGDTMGAIFGLAAILWFLIVGMSLILTAKGTTQNGGDA